LADRTKIGEKHKFRWEVEKGKIRELVDAIGDKNPIYTDARAAQDQGYKDIVAPPTFGTVPLMWTGTLIKALNDLQVNFARIVHAEQAYEYYEEIFPGDTLDAILEVKDITKKEGKSGTLEFIRFETKYQNQDGVVVLGEDMLLVERS